MNRVPAPLNSVLSSEEIRLVIAYRKMDARRRHENLALMEDDAAAYPARIVPALRLVDGGVK